MGEDQHRSPDADDPHSGMFSPRDDPQIVPTAGPGDPLLVGYRPDIDGLRGFGAFLVVWFHFEETWNQSSYKGADLTNSTFFAVSGFVVSLTVLKARRRNAFEFTLKNNCGFALLFLLRRLQRLVMAQLCTTFLTVWVFLAILPPGDRLVRLLDTATYSLIGGANIYFAGLGEEGGGNYLDDVPEETSLSRNPLMHTWYLGLEEQFYLCYPWMFVAAHISKVYLVFGFLAVVSFCFYVRFEEKDPVTAFFMLHCRGWEVLVGVLSCHLVVHSGVSCIRRRSASDERRGIESMRRAVFGPTPISGNSSTNESTLSANKKRRVNWWFLSGQIFAVSTIWYSLYLFWCTTAFCRIIATCFAMSGTAMFFITGHDQDWEKIDTMSITDLNFLNDVSLLNYLYARSLPQYIGRISYALYLWHFPVNVLCAQFRKEMIAAVPFLEFAMIALVFQIFVMTALSVFSYHLIEDPYRRWRADKQGLPSWTPIAIILMFVVILEVVVAHFRGLVRAAVQEAFFERAAHVHTTESRPFVSRNLAVAGIVFFLGGVFVVTLYRFLSGSGSGAEEGATSGSGHPMPLTKRILLRWWKYGCLSLSLSILICWKWSITCGLTLALHLERKEGNSVSSDKDGRGEDNYTENGFGFWEDENFGKQLKVAEIISGFSSRACACRKTDGNLWSSPGAVAPSPGGTTGESVSGLDPQRYPVCFDTDFWKKQARLYGNSVNPEEVRGEWQTCHGNVKSPLPDVDKMWADCHFDALLGNKHGKNNGDPRRKAFLFGNSHAMALRFAVANALGDHFSVFARSDAYFDKLELFSYLIEESTVEPSAPQGGAGSIEDPKSANDLVERFIDEVYFHSLWMVIGRALEFDISYLKTSPEYQQNPINQNPPDLGLPQHRTLPPIRARARRSKNRDSLGGRISASHSVLDKSRATARRPRVPGGAPPAALPVRGGGPSEMHGGRPKFSPVRGKAGWVVGAGHGGLSDLDARRIGKECGVCRCCASVWDWTHVSGQFGQEVETFPKVYSAKKGVSKEIRSGGGVSGGVREEVWNEWDDEIYSRGSTTRTRRSSSHDRRVLVVLRPALFRQNLRLGHPGHIPTSPRRRLASVRHRVLLSRALSVLFPPRARPSPQTEANHPSFLPRASPTGPFRAPCRQRHLLVSGVRAPNTRPPKRGVRTGRSQLRSALESGLYPSHGSFCVRRERSVSGFGGGRVEAVSVRGTALLDGMREDDRGAAAGLACEQGVGATQKFETAEGTVVFAIVLETGVVTDALQVGPKERRADWQTTGGQEATASPNGSCRSSCGC